MAEIKIKFSTEIFIKVGFYVVWGLVLWFCVFVIGEDEMFNFPKKVFCGDDYQGWRIQDVYVRGFVSAFAIQVIFGMLKWLIFDRHPKVEVQKNESE